jgi:hypothetical protein
VNNNRTLHYNRMNINSMGTVRLKDMMLRKYSEVERCDDKKIKACYTASIFFHKI